MRKNPILTWFAHYLSLGRTIRAAIIDNKNAPTKITFEFSTGEQTAVRPIKAKDRDQFVQWWKQATAYFRENLLKIENAKRIAVSRQASKRNSRRDV